MLRIANLAGVFTGLGFAEKQGRRPTEEDCGFLAGPLDIICSQTTGLIESIEAHSKSSYPGVTRTFDASGLVATAGFVDSHTHAIFSGNRANEFFLRWKGATYREISDSGGGIHQTVRCTNECDDTTLMALLQDRLRSMLACGTTTVEVKSGYSDSPAGELRLLRLIKSATSSTDDLPEVLATFLGLHALPRSSVEADYCEAMIDVLRAVKTEQLASFVDAFPERGFFSCEHSLRFLAAGKERGLGIKVHADEITNLGASSKAIELEALSIDHLEHVDNQTVELLSTSATVATILPATSFFLGIPYANARRLIDAGACVALATDFNPGSAPAYDFQFTTLLAASQLKMSPSEILCACTYNGANALNLGYSHGILNRGRVANSALWRDPSWNRDTKSDALLERIFVGREKPIAIVMRGAIHRSPQNRS